MPYTRLYSPMKLIRPIG